MPDPIRAAIESVINARLASSLFRFTNRLPIYGPSGISQPPPVGDYSSTQCALKRDTCCPCYDVRCPNSDREAIPATPGREDRHAVRCANNRSFHQTLPFLRKTRRRSVWVSERSRTVLNGTHTSTNGVLIGMRVEEDSAKPGAFQYYARLERLGDWVSRHLDETITIRQAARVTAMTTSSFSRFFGRECGMSFASWLATQRAHEARRLLQSRNVSLPELADQTGFGSVRTLQRTFKRCFGMTPSQYRDLVRSTHRRRATGRVLSAESLTQTPKTGPG